MEDETLTRIYTSIENIDGMIDNLSAIMDSNGFNELNKKYKVLDKKVPRNTVLSNEEKQFGHFGVDLKYYNLDGELRDFEKELSEYNIYKSINDKVNEIKNNSKNIFKDANSIDLYVRLNEELVMLIFDGSKNKYSQQFTTLMKESFDTLFNSLKVLSSFDDKRLIEFINKYESGYVRENISSLIRSSIDTSKLKGSLDDDHIDYDTIVKCSLNDPKTLNILEEAEKYSKMIKEERENNLRIEEENKKRLELIRKRKKLLKLKLGLIKFLIVPSIALPMSCPIAGYAIGKRESNKINLTKTITTTVDMDNHEILNSSEDYLEYQTSYVASLTICEPYKKNISGTSYSRICNVYDYDTTGLDINDEITKDNLDESRKTLKYSYEQSTPIVENEKYLTEQQFLITETYQDLNTTTKSNKYTTSGTLIGLGTGLGISTSGFILYNNGLSYYIDDKKKEYTKELKSLGE